ncbi:MAG: hypothetical protein V7785_22045 [Bermanella sp.]
MSWLNFPNSTLNSGSNIVNIHDSADTSNVEAGYALVVNGAFYEILSKSDNTLTLTENYPNASQANIALKVMQTHGPIADKLVTATQRLSSNSDTFETLEGAAFKAVGKKAGTVADALDSVLTFDTVAALLAEDLAVNQVVKIKGEEDDFIVVLPDTGLVGSGKYYDLANGNQIKRVKVWSVENVTDLMTTRPTYHGQEFYLEGHTEKAIGAGSIYYDANDTDAVHNGGDIFINDFGEVFKRKEKSYISFAEFGSLESKADNFLQIQAAFDSNIGRSSRRMVVGDFKVYGVKTGKLIMDSSTTTLHGVVLDFSVRQQAVPYYFKYTNTNPDIGVTYSNPLGGLERVELRGQGNDVLENNNGIELDSDVGSTVATASTTFRNVVVTGMADGVSHFDSSYNLTWDTCSFYRNSTALKYPSGQTDTFERSVLNSCNIFNNHLGFDIQSANGVVYLNSCSLDYNKKHIFASAGGIEVNASHLEAPINDQALIEIKNAATFNAVGGWWQFGNGVVNDAPATAIEEFKCSESTVKGAISIRDVKFSSYGGPVFTTTPENMDVVNPKPDSTSLLSLNRFIRHRITADPTFINGVFPGDIWLAQSGIESDRYSGAAGSIAIETADSANAYSGNNYLKASKIFGSGSEFKLKMAVPLTDKRRATAHLQAKALGAHTPACSMQVAYATLSSNVEATDFRPYVVTNYIEVGDEAFNLSTSYQKFAYGLRERADSWHTHAILTFNMFELDNADIAIDDLFIVLV